MDKHIDIQLIGQNAVVVVVHDDGEPPRAFTISEIRDWVSEAMTTDELSNERFGRGSIVDMILERLELDLLNPK